MSADEGREEEDEIQRVHADICIRRTIASLPQSTVRVWAAFKRLLFLGGVGALFYLVLSPSADVPMTGRIVICLVVAWMIWDALFTRHRVGTSHVLVTSKGVLFTEENVYVRWEEIESYQHAGNLIRFRPKPGFGPSGFLASSELDVPLSPANREFLLELFRERVERWKPNS